MGASNGESQGGLLEAGGVLDAFAVDFDVDPGTGEMHSSARLNALLGYDERRALKRDDFYARVHPDDAPALRALSSGGQPDGPLAFDHEFRILAPDGSVRWVLARGEIHWRAGRPLRIRGACLDITDRKRREQAAHESEVRYRALAQSSPGAILVACGGVYVYANDAAARLLRASSPRELVGRSPFELLVPEYHELIRLRLQHVLEQRTALERVRHRWLRLDGSEIDVDVAAAWVPWSGEDAVQLVAHDITNEVLVEEALRESRAQLADEERRKSFLLELNDTLRGLADARQILLQAATMLGKHLGAARVGYGEDRGDGATFAVMQHYTAPGARGVEGIYRYVSYGADQLHALRAGRMLIGPDPEKPGVFHEAMRSAHRARDVAAAINVPLVRAGQLVALLFVHFNEARAWPDDEVGLIEIVAARTWDAVERARAETALRESEARLAVVFETLPIGIGLLDTSGRLVLSNPEMQRFLPNRLMPSRDIERLGRWRAYKPDGTRVEPDDYPGARALRGEEVRPGIEMAYLQDDGREVWTRVAAMPTRDSGGRVVGAVAAVMDIDAVKRSADALRDSEECFRNLVEAYAQAVWEADADGMQVSDSPSWRAYTGQTFDQMLGTGWADAVHPDDRAAAERRWNEAVAARRSFDSEFRLRRAAGDWRWTNVRATPLLDADGTVRKWVGMNIDIDARRRAEDGLRESHAQLHLATIASHAGWGTLDFATDTMEWDEAGRQIIGFASEEESRTLPGWLARIHPADRDRVLDHVDSCLRDGEDFSLDYRVVRADGAVRLIRAYGHFRKAADGHPLTGTGLVIDVTEQSAAEQERQRAEQALADAARHKDEFLAMLSHELRNPLAPIRNSVYLLRHLDGNSAGALHAHDVIERQTQHLARLVDDLLDVTRIARGKIELRKVRADLCELVRRAGDDQRALLESGGVRLTVRAPADEVWCEVDPTRLNQAIGNLLANAAKFTQRGDQVDLALAVVGGEARISVADTGAGIEAGLLPRVFDPFVQGDRTLARSAGGLGLGLALVRGIAELHGGRAHASSEGTGHGSEFVITLPLVACEPERAGTARPRAHEGQSRRVLVVDDNVDAAESLATIVRLLGHAVDVVHDGPSALAKVREAAPDVVLCDIGLPRMSGYEVAQTLRRDLEYRGRLIAVSGYAQPEDIRRGVDAGFDGHLAKPFDPEGLDAMLS